MRDNDWIMIGSGTVMGGAIAATLFADMKVPLQQDAVATIIVGATALVAAAWTIKAVRLQVEKSDQLEEDRRKRRERSARATLPLALSQFVDYAESCMAILGPLRLCFSGNALNHSAAQALILRLPRPHMPDAAISTIKECIEFSDERTAAVLAQALQQAQVQHSRFDGVISAIMPSARVHRLLSPIDVDGGIVDCGAVRARCDKLFSYARSGTVDDLAPTAADVLTALNLSSHVDDFNHADAFTRASQWKPFSWMNE